MDHESKYEKLKEILAKIDRPLLAFSGGVDSTLLAGVAAEMGLDLKAITINSPFIPEKEIEEAAELAKDLNIDHQIINIEFEQLGKALKNSPERCYYCKKMIFSKIKEYAEAEKRTVIEGTNQDDQGDYRPGLRALKELKIRSPLFEAGLRKSEIRELSASLDLPTWDKPSLSCLATRVAYDSEITEEKLARIETAEKYLAELGFNQYRVRDHNDLARIEVLPEERKKLFDLEVLDDLNNKLKSLGFDYVTFDLGGYKSGSMNQSPEVEDE
ncbi:ATP-dependent sacrificial sulfur transferase LarE [Halanaerobiaceae bacterium Z-7014]|uniref:ATP-dependent sacrificial sulfur transferase LarE n=1 Tax=Halonatronomonas betaini TaxID=2778430 RepID=A0A931AW06_9FIRM|nr:ATP-dependent sacrificial sulfur transferase LarE [Halonatronomonas betaini]MBF8437131.1 ATP-dependent sacrificial sulfur transferase LarE [Halonatronomonas betaini]